MIFRTVLAVSLGHLAHHIVEDASVLVVGQLHICINPTSRLHTYSTVRLLCQHYIIIMNQYIVHRSRFLIRAEFFSLL